MQPPIISKLGVAETWLIACCWALVWVKALKLDPYNNLYYTFIPSQSSAKVICHIFLFCSFNLKSFNSNVLSSCLLGNYLINRQQTTCTIGRSWTCLVNSSITNAKRLGLNAECWYKTIMRYDLLLSNYVARPWPRPHQYGHNTLAHDKFLKIHMTLVLDTFRTRHGSMRGVSVLHSCTITSHIS